MLSQRLLRYRWRPAPAALATLMQSAGRAAAVATLLALNMATVHAADAAHGMQVYRSCAACHSDRPDAIGPSLKGVIGRKSGSVDGYRYSGPMRRAHLVWDEANLKQYIADPQSKVPGNRMPFGGVHDPRDVDDLVAYLKTLN